MCSPTHIVGQGPQFTVGRLHRGSFATEYSTQYIIVKHLLKVYISVIPTGVTSLQLYSIYNSEELITL